MRIKTKGRLLNTTASEPSRRVAPYARWLGASLFGVGSFLLPVYYDGSWTIVLGIAANAIGSALGEHMALFTVPLFVIGAIVTAVYRLAPRAFVAQLPLSERLAHGHWLSTVLCVLGGMFALATLTGFGPTWMTSADTGGTAYVDVAGAIFILIGLGCLFLPFLTDYGFLEFVGTLLQRPFQLLFRLPGRSAVDVLASWVGSSSIAVLMTSFQYERGFYSAREAAVIVTNFSVVSVPFVYLTAQVAGIEDYFLTLAATMVFVCVVCAVLTPKLPPLKGFKDRYHEPVGKRFSEDGNPEGPRLQLAVQRAVDAAAGAPGLFGSLKRGLVTMLDIYLTMMPAAMTIEFIALVIYHHTNVLQVVTYPLALLLAAAGVPEAFAAAPGLLIGLLDQFVPAIIAGQLTSPLTSFILAGLSVTQLIFFAETALLITRSAIPLSVLQLVAIFLLRTAIALPLLLLIAHALF